MIAVQVDNKLKQVASVFETFTFSFEGTEDQAKNIIGSANKAQFETKGQRGNTPWEQEKPSTIKEKQRLGFGGKQPLERTGALKQIVINPQVQAESANVESITFSGDEAFLIDVFKDRFPLLVFTTPDYNALGQVFAKANVARLNSGLSEALKS